jgi:hypothetical protein
MRANSLKPVQLIVAGALLACASTAAAQSPVAERLRDPSTMVVVAHRGCVGEAPEVSIASIHACAGKGINAVEMDVRTSRDGHLVAIHDTTVDRTTDGEGKVAEMTLAELQKLRLRRGNGGKSVVVTDEPLPTLRQMLLAARQHEFIVHLDIKEASYQSVAELVDELGMRGHTTVWVTGKPGDATHPDPKLADVLGVVPRIQECPPSRGPGCKSAPLDTMTGFAPYNPPGYFLWFLTTEEEFKRFKVTPRAPGARLMTETLWDIDNLPTPQRHAHHRRLKELGASYFITDKPADMAAFFRSLEAGK